MNTESLGNDPMEEFEEEFSPEKDHPLQILGASLILICCVGVLVLWVVTLLNTLRY